MRKFGTRRTGRRTLAGLAALALVVAGLTLIWNSFSGGDEVRAKPAPVVHAQTMFASKKPAPGVPADETMRLSVPKMARVEDVPVYTAPASDNATLDRGALHVEGTGFPWQQGANVYIAGHRLGYTGTGSYLLFYDLDRLEDGDEVVLTDSNGTRYTYRVFRKFLVDPSAYQVTRPVPGKSVVSLQTCTLPDYSQRMIVQAELVG
jgi:sortase A